MIGLIDIGIQPRSRFDEPARGLTLVGYVFLSEKIGRLFAFLAFGRRTLRGMFARDCVPLRMLADGAPDWVRKSAAFPVEISPGRRQGFA
jgi:hypothetical protein